MLFSTFHFFFTFSVGTAQQEGGKASRSASLAPLKMKSCPSKRFYSNLNIIVKTAETTSSPPLASVASEGEKLSNFSPSERPFFKNTLFFMFDAFPCVFGLRTTWLQRYFFSNDRKIASSDRNKTGPNFGQGAFPTGRSRQKK